MAWEVEYTDQFEGWWERLGIEQQEALDDRVMLLAEVGPGLGRPVVDTITGSRHANMKELRASQGGALRVCSPSTHGGARSCCWAGTSRAAGMSGTGGRFPRRMRCTTSISGNCALRA